MRKIGFHQTVCNLLLIGLLLTTCKTTYKVTGFDIIIDDTPGGEQEKYRSFRTPKTSHAPGYIFRTSRKSSGHPWVTTLVDSSIIKENFVSIPTTKINNSFNYLLRFCGFDALNIKGNWQKNINVTLKFDSCISEMASEIDLERLISTSNINFKQKEKYYIIQKTIKAKRITLKLDDYNLIDANIKVQIDTLLGTLNERVIANNELNGEIVIRRKESNTIEMCQEFDIPHRIFHTICEIDQSGLLSDGTKQYILTPEYNVIIEE